MSSKNMVLQGLLLENFKQHASLSLEFGPGVTAIRGANYCGKSTLLEAVRFALCGLSAIPNTRETVVRWGEKNCLVQLRFGTGAAVIVIKRTLTSASVEANGALVATSQTAVNDWVEDFTGMNQKNLLALLSSPQGETAALLTMGATALNSLIEEIADTSTVDTLVEKASAIYKKADAQLEALPEAVDLVPVLAEQAKLQSDHDDIETLKGVLEASKLKINALCAAIGDEIKKALAHNTQMQELSRSVAKYEGMRDSRKAALDEAEKHFAGCSIQDYSILEGALKDAVTQIRDLRDTSEAIRAQVAIRDSAEAWLNSKGVEYTKKQAEFGPKVQALQAELEEVKAAQVRGHAMLCEAQKKLHEATEALKSAVCFTCKRPFDASHLEEAKKKVEDLTLQVVSCEKVNRAVQDLWTEKNGNLGDMRNKLPPHGWELQHKHYTAQLALALKELNSIVPVAPGELEEAIAYEASLAGQIRAAKAKNEEYKEAERKVTRLKLSLSEAECFLKAVKLEPEIDISSLIQGRDERETERATIEKDLTDLLMRRNKCQFELVRVNNIIALEEKHEKARSSLSSRSQRFKAFQKWLSSNKARFMSDTWEGLLGLASEFTNQATFGEVSRIGRDNEGKFWFEQNGKIQPVTGCASGGQKAIMGVAVRAALPSLLMPGLPLLLDEPSAELNDEHSAALGGALRALGRQVVVVTHKDGDESSADMVVCL